VEVQNYGHGEEWDGNRFQPYKITFRIAAKNKLIEEIIDKKLLYKGWCAKKAY
jgi:hypothetical protein